MLYYLLGTGIGITLLLVYIRYNVRQRERLKRENESLASQKKYRDEVIEIVSKRPSVDGTIDELRSGEF